MFKLKLIFKEILIKFGLQMIYTDKDKKLYKEYKFKDSDTIWKLTQK